MTTDVLQTVDLKILEQIQQDASLSTSELADRVGLSQSPCWRRLQKLKDDGFIRKQVCLLERSKFGYGFVIFAHLKMAKLSDEMRESFLRKVMHTPEILECHTVFGEIDVILKVLAPTLPWYQNFIFNVILKFPGVEDIRSTVTLSEVKYETAIPVRGSRAL